MLVKPLFYRAFADKSVFFFLSKVGMEPTKTDLPRVSHISHPFSTYQKLRGPWTTHRRAADELTFITDTKKLRPEIWNPTRDTLTCTPDILINFHDRCLSPIPVYT